MLKRGYEQDQSKKNTSLEDVKALEYFLTY